MCVEKIGLWITSKKKGIKEDVVSWGFEEGSESYACTLKSHEANLDKLVAFVKECVDEKDPDKVKLLFPYFENLSHNRDTAFLFSTLTGISVGKTNKSGIAAFVEYFGSDVPDEIAKKEETEKQTKYDLEMRETEEKLREQKEYFSSPLWVHEKTSQLTALQYGRVEKVLEKLWNFNGEIETLKENLLKLSLDSKAVTNNMYKWNRKKSNGMYADEQEEYERKLIKGRSYFIYYGDYSRSVPKMVYELLNLEDSTDEEGLAS